MNKPARKPRGTYTRQRGGAIRRRDVEGKRTSQPKRTGTYIEPYPCHAQLDW